MANKRTFTMNGNTYGSMMEIARELGIKRVYPRDFAKYGIEEVTSTPADDNTAQDKEATATAATEETKAEDKKIEKEVVKDSDKEDSDMNKTKKAAAQTLEDFSAQLKAMSLDELVALAKKKKVDTYEQYADEKIRRMRITMALKNKMFPGQKLNNRKASFRKVSLDALKEFAKEVGVVDYRVTSEERTQRMWLVHSLNEAGYYDIPEKKAE